MKKVFGKNQIVITALAVMIAVAGYLSVTQDKSLEVANIDEGDGQDENAGSEESQDIAADGTIYDISDIDVAEENIVAPDVIDADAVDGTDVQETDAGVAGDVPEQPSAGAEEQAGEETGANTVGEAVLVSSTIGAEYFDAAKISREQTRSKNKEILMELVNSASTTEAQKEKAVAEVIELTSNLEKETSAETMLEAKGFGNCIVSIVEGKADVIVNANNLTEKDIAQIEDVVKRKTDIAAGNIVITPVGVTQ